MSIDTNLRMFQYKILNNILYPNKQLFLFKKRDYYLCFCCSMEEETINHIFINCQKTKSLWFDLKLYLNNIIDIPELDPQSAIFGFSRVTKNYY